MERKGPMMARDNLKNCLAITLNHEGGYADHPSDPGGATNWGITHKTLAAYRGRSVTKQDVRSLSITEAQAIYDKNYWKPINGDMLPYGVDLAAFDAGVNSGPSRGAKWLQRAVGVKQDGKIGQATLRATAALPGDATVRAMCGYRLSFVQGLGTWKVFGKGWGRRIADIEARGVAMWLRFGAGKSAGQVHDELVRQSDGALSKSDAQAKTAGGAGAGGAVVGGGDLASAGTGWLLVVAGVVVLAAVLVWVRSRQNRELAVAYEMAAQEQHLDAMAGQ